MAYAADAEVLPMLNPIVSYQGRIFMGKVAPEKFLLDLMDPNRKGSSSSPTICIRGELFNLGGVSFVLPTCDSIWIMFVWFSGSMYHHNNKFLEDIKFIMSFLFYSSYCGWNMP